MGLLFRLIAFSLFFQNSAEASCVEEVRNSDLNTTKFLQSTYAVEACEKAETLAQDFQSSVSPEKAAANQELADKFHRAVASSRIASDSEDGLGVMEQAEFNQFQKMVWQEFPQSTCGATPSTPIVKNEILPENNRNVDEILISQSSATAPKRITPITKVILDPSIKASGYHAGILSLKVDGRISPENLAILQSHYDNMAKDKGVGEIELQDLLRNMEKKQKIAPFCMNFQSAYEKFNSAAAINPTLCQPFRLRMKHIEARAKKADRKVGECFRVCPTCKDSFLALSSPPGMMWNKALTYARLPAQWGVDLVVLNAKKKQFNSISGKIKEKQSVFDVYCPTTDRTDCEEIKQGFIRDSEIAAANFVVAPSLYSNAFVGVSSFFAPNSAPLIPTQPGMPYYSPNDYLNNMYTSAWNSTNGIPFRYYR